MEQGRLGFFLRLPRGSHERILRRLVDTNLEKMAGYGFDPISQSARRRIRQACERPGAEIQFLEGGPWPTRS